MARTTLALILSALTLLLVGCGGSSFEGDWTIDSKELEKIILASVEKDSEGETEETKKMMLEMAGSMAEAIKVNLSLKADGTFTATSGMMDQTETTTGTWTESGGTITMVEDADASDPVTGTIDGDMLMLDFPNAMGGPEKLPMIRTTK